MKQPWEPEWALETPVALQLIQTQFPDLHAKEIKLVGTGWNNSAFLINEKYIFRFPRRTVSLPMLEVEWETLPKLAPLLPAAIPIPLWKGAPSHLFPHLFIGYRILPYHTACSKALSENERGKLATSLAFFLSTLHKASPSILPQNHPFGHNLSRIDPQIILPKIMQNLSHLEELNLFSHRKKLERLLQKSFRRPIVSTLVHGDFYVRHILIDAKQQLQGVIDWGDIHLGDPAMDLAIAHSFLPPDAHDLFRKTYGEISEDTWLLAYLRSIHSNSLFTLYGYHSKDPDIIREGLRSLHTLSLQ